MLLPTSTTATAYSYTGYIVDNFCWDKPNHTGIDGTNLEKNPGGHILHCLVFSFCIRDGYVALERIPDVDSTLFPNGQFRTKHLLDVRGNALMEELANSELARASDYAFDEEITIDGELTNTTSEELTTIAVQTLRFTPQRNNAENVEICHGKCGDSTTTTTTTTTSTDTSDVGDGDSTTTTTTKDETIGSTDTVGGTESTSDDGSSSSGSLSLSMVWSFWITTVTMVAAFNIAR